MKSRFLRLLTLVSFFHFMGLNNGFTFMSVQLQPFQPVSFAPVFLKTLCVSVNPFAWKAALNLRFIKKAVFSSSRALSVSSRNAIHRYHPSSLVPELQLRPARLNEFVGNLFSFQRFGWVAHSPTANEGNHGEVSCRELDGMKISFQRTLNGGDIFVQPQRAAELVGNVLRIQSHSHAILKRADERDPEKQIELNLRDFVPAILPGSGDALKIHQLYEKQASLPSRDPNMSWRHARGLGDDPLLNLKGGPASR